MIIKKYTAKTEKEAIEAAKKELGENIVIMNVKNAKKKGKVDTYGWRGETTNTPSSSSSPNASPSPENQHTPVPSSNQNSAMDQQQREANEALRRVDPVTDSRSSDAPR